MNGALQFHLSEVIKLGAVIATEKFSVGKWHTATDTQRYAVVSSDGSHDNVISWSSWDAAQDFISIVGRAQAAKAIDQYENRNA